MAKETFASRVVQSFSSDFSLVSQLIVFAALSSLVALPRKTILDMRRFGLKKRTIWKTRGEIDVRRYPYRASLI